MSKYNATVTKLDSATGQEIGCFLAEVDDAGVMLRSNWLQFTGLEGTAAYDAYLRRAADCEYVIHRDGGRGYRRRLLGLALPPAYRR